MSEAILVWHTAAFSPGNDREPLFIKGQAKRTHKLYTSKFDNADRMSSRIDGIILT